MLFPPDGGWDKIFFLTAAKRIGDTEDTERGDAYSNHQEGGFGAIGFEGGVSWMPINGIPVLSAGWAWSEDCGRPYSVSPATSGSFRITFELSFLVTRTTGGFFVAINSAGLTGSDRQLMQAEREHNTAACTNRLTRQAGPKERDRDTAPTLRRIPETNARSWAGVKHSDWTPAP
jgi:hypothetical protein